MPFLVIVAVYFKRSSHNTLPMGNIRYHEATLCGSSRDQVHINKCIYLIRVFSFFFFFFAIQDVKKHVFQVPRNRYWGLHPPPVPLEQVIDDGLIAIQRSMFLRKAGVDTVADEDFLLNPPSRSELLESAIKNIIRFLL